MKKLISSILALAMASTMFVSVANADMSEFKPQIISSEPEVVENDEFAEIFEEDIPTGYVAYKVVVNMANLGSHTITKSGTKYSGEGLSTFQYKLTFDNANLANVHQDYCMSVEGVLEVESGFKGNDYNTTWTAGSAKNAKSLDGTLDEVCTAYILVEEGKTAEATVGFAGKIESFSSNTSTGSTYAVPTFSPATVVFSSTAAPEITIQFSEDAPTSGTVGTDIDLADYVDANTDVTYSIVSGPATVSAAGVVSATGEGSVVVKVTSADDEDVYDTITIVFSNPAPVGPTFIEEFTIPAGLDTNSIPFNTIVNGWYYTFVKPSFTIDVNKLDKYQVYAISSEDNNNTYTWNMFSVKGTMANGIDNGFEDIDGGITEGKIKNGEYDGSTSFYVTIKSNEKLSKVNFIELD